MSRKTIITNALIPNHISCYYLNSKVYEDNISSIYIATNKYTQTQCTAIVYSKELSYYSIASIHREIFSLKMLKHRNILQLYEVIETKNHIHLFTELRTGKELFEHITQRKRLSEKEALMIFQQIVDAMKYMHKMTIAHRDIRPENITIDPKGIIKLINFGSSIIYNKFQLIKDHRDSNGYSCPEMMLGKGYSAVKCDVWSLGVLLYAMVCGFLPFCEEDDEKNKEMIVKGDYLVPEKGISDQVKDLIKNMLEIDPLKRYDFYQITNHAWFNSNKPSLVNGLNVLEYKFPIDKRILTLCSKYGFDQDKLTQELMNNNMTHGTAVYMLCIAMVLENNKMSCSDLSSKEFTKYLEVQKNQYTVTTIQNRYNEMVQNEKKILEMIQKEEEELARKEEESLTELNKLIDQHKAVNDDDTDPDSIFSIVFNGKRSQTVSYKYKPTLANILKEKELKLKQNNFLRRNAKINTEEIKQAIKLFEDFKNECPTVDNDNDKSNDDNKEENNHISNDLEITNEVNANETTDKRLSIIKQRLSESESDIDIDNENEIIIDSNLTQPDIKSVQLEMFEDRILYKEREFQLSSLIEDSKIEKENDTKNVTETSKEIVLEKGEIEETKFEIGLELNESIVKEKEKENKEEDVNRTIKEDQANVDKEDKAVNDDNDKEHLIEVNVHKNNVIKEEVSIISKEDKMIEMERDVNDNNENINRTRKISIETEEAEHKSIREKVAIDQALLEYNTNNLIDAGKEIIINNFNTNEPIANKESNNNQQTIVNNDSVTDMIIESKSESPYVCDNQLLPNRNLNPYTIDDISTNNYKLNNEKDLINNIIFSPTPPRKPTLTPSELLSLSSHSNQKETIYIISPLQKKGLIQSAEINSSLKKQSTNHSPLMRNKKRKLEFSTEEFSSEFFTKINKTTKPSPSRTNTRKANKGVPKPFMTRMTSKEKKYSKKEKAETPKANGINSHQNTPNAKQNVNNQCDEKKLNLKNGISKMNNKSNKTVYVKDKEKANKKKKDKVKKTKSGNPITPYDTIQMNNAKTQQTTPIKKKIIKSNIIEDNNNSNINKKKISKINPNNSTETLLKPNRTNTFNFNNEYDIENNNDDYSDYNEYNEYNELYDQYQLSSIRQNKQTTQLNNTVSILSIRSKEKDRINQTHSNTESQLKDILQIRINEKKDQKVKIKSIKEKKAVIKPLMMLNSKTLFVTSAHKPKQQKQKVKNKEKNNQPINNHIEKQEDLRIGVRGKNKTKNINNSKEKCHYLATESTTGKILNEETIESTGRTLNRNNFNLLNYYTARSHNQMTYANDDYDIHKSEKATTPNQDSNDRYISIVNTNSLTIAGSNSKEEPLAKTYSGLIDLVCIASSSLNGTINNLLFKLKDKGIIYNQKTRLNYACWKDELSFQVDIVELEHSYGLAKKLYYYLVRIEEGSGVGLRTNGDDDHYLTYSISSLFSD